MLLQSEVEVNGVTVKGWRNGLLLLIPADGDWDSVVTQMDARLDEAKARSFWRGAQTTIDCGMRAVTLDELTVLVDRMKRAFGLVPIAVVATDAATRAAGEKLALTPYSEMPVIKKPVRDRDAADSEPTASMPASQVPPNASNALYVPGTIRSGQRIVHEGHLVICGDVNAGAEVMAAGDVLIFGTLRGLAHAGCMGDETARIVATSLRPPQLRIATKIARAPEEPHGKSIPGGKTGPEVARIENGEIQVFPL
jgi:septum site-determining protein MinC